MEYRYIFGPVNSRRLGTSLGIDLLPLKTCTLDCAYCECGATTKLTLEREEYVPTKAVLAELDHFLTHAKKLPAYVTFSGSGEPTLHSGIGEIISHIKERYPEQKVALLTNSTLLIDSSVRSEIIQADLIMPSLDAVTQEVFAKILMPHPSLKAADIITGIKLLQAEYKGRLVVEVFIVPGGNDSDAELGRIRSALVDIAPDSIVINHLDRKGAYEWVKDLDKAALDRVVGFFQGLPVEPVKYRDIPFYE